MLNTTTAKPISYAIGSHIRERIAQVYFYKECNIPTFALWITAHITEIKQLQYQLLMTPERVLCVTEDYLSAAFKNARLKGL